MPSPAGRHRHRTPTPPPRSAPPRSGPPADRAGRPGKPARSGRAALLTLLATLALLLGSGTAAVSLAGAPAPDGADAPSGVAALGEPAPARGTLDAGATGSAGVGTAPAPTQRADSPPSRGDRPAPGTAGPERPELAERVTALTNAERTAAGCDELRIDERLRTAARGHSTDMAERDYFSHTTPEGDSASDRAREAGFPGGVGENIAMGYPTPEAVVAGWMDSDGHRDNLLNCRYTVIGVGLAYDGHGRAYWTQNFGQG